MQAHVTELTSVLQAHLPWHKARLTFFARFVLALLQLGTVNLTKLALALNPRVRSASNYRRIQRFLSGFALEGDACARLLLSLVPSGGPFLVILDRTNWQFGTRDLNILLLAVAHRGIAFPILWTVLEKKGNSNTAERIALLRRFLRLVPPERIEALLADREFIGTRWFGFLLQERIPFYIRIKHNLQVSGKCRIVSAASLFASLPLTGERRLRGRREICGQRLHLVGMRYRGRTHKIEYLLLVASHRPEKALACYGRRWEVETLFGALKSRGFDLEATHVSHADRLEKLLALLAFAFAWAHHVGEWLHETVAPVKKKTHGRASRSLFRHGLDLLQSVLLNLEHRYEAFQICLYLLRNPMVLSCT